MKIDGKTRVCGLIGNPVEHTMSPMIHNTLAEKLEIPFVYVPFLVTDNLEAAIRGAFALNICGMNITIPHKSGVMEYLQDCDELAGKIGAVNTLVRQDGGYKGYNTDISGLFRAISGEGIRIEGENIIILGAGGAARAVAYLCAHKEAGRVFLLNRSVDKAKEVAGEVNAAFGRECIRPMALRDFALLPKERMLCIQATSVGLMPDADKVIIAREAFYRRIHTGYDLIYRPANTRFMQLVKAHGGQAYHGLKMLLYQAVEAFEKWNNVQIEEELAQEVYGKLKEEMGIEE